MEIARHRHRVGLSRRDRLHRRNFVIAIIVHHVVRRDESRHVTPGFARQVRINRPIIARTARPLDGFEHIVASAIVRRDGQGPVSERFVEVFEISCGRLRRFDGVATLVQEAIHRQSVVLRRRHHELPESRGTHTTGGHRVESTFHHGKIFQLEGNALRLQGLFKDRHIKVLHAQHEAHRAAQASRVLVNVVLHHLVVRHLDEVGQAAQAVEIDFAGENRDLIGVERGIHAHVFLHVPPVDLRVDTVEHTLRGRHLRSRVGRVVVDVGNADGVVGGQNHRCRRRCSNTGEGQRAEILIDTVHHCEVWG